MEQYIIKTDDGEEYLILDGCNDTLASMVALKQVPVYWIGLDNKLIELIDRPQYIYGASPNRFGIRLN